MSSLRTLSSLHTLCLPQNRLGESRPHTEDTLLGRQSDESSSSPAVFGVCSMLRLPRQPSTWWSWQTSSPAPPPAHSDGWTSGENCCLLLSLTHTARLLGLRGPHHDAIFNHPSSDLNVLDFTWLHHRLELPDWFICVYSDYF